MSESGIFKKSIFSTILVFILSSTAIVLVFKEARIPSILCAIFINYLAFNAGANKWWGCVVAYLILCLFSVLGAFFGLKWLIALGIFITSTPIVCLTKSFSNAAWYKVSVVYHILILVVFVIGLIKGVSENNSNQL